MAIDYSLYHRDSDYRKFERTFRNIFQLRFNLISKYIKSPGRVLDIGASIGTFLSIYKDHGWEVLGIDPSRTTATKKGIKIINGYIEEVKFPENYFDLVILNHTLEHLDNPVLVLKKVNKILKKGGIVFVDVPNAGGLGSKILGSKWAFRCPEEHKWQFTKKSLSSVFKKSGFEILYWESRSGIFEYANPLLEIYRKRFLLDLVMAPYSLIVTLLNMGDSMSMIGRKP